jgi:hypothetical protein
VRAAARWAWLLLIPVIPVLQVRIDREWGAFRPQQEALYVWSGARLKRMAPGFENLLADIYWLRTVQYFGGERLFAKEKRFELLRPLISITTTLDPRLEIAYRYGAIFLAEPWDRGAGRPDEAIAVLQEGVRNNPASWKLRWDLGYFRYAFKKDPQGGAAVLLEGARLPGAPFWLETLAGQILSKGGDRPTSRLVWQRIYEQSEPGALRENAAHHLANLDALDGADVVQKAVDAFQQRHGRFPSSLTELPGLGGRIPADPSGTPFRYDARNGRVEIDPKSQVWSPS